MVIKIQSVTSEKDKAAMRWVRQQTFEREMGLMVEQLGEPKQPGAFHLLVLELPDEEPVAALSVIDTSGDKQLHDQYLLKFDSQARVARYSQLTVLNSHRRMNLSIRMFIEAHHQFVIPLGFDYTWLLFDAERGSSSPMCNHLAFIPNVQAFPSEFGLSCSLVRDEHTALSKQAIRETEEYLQQCSLQLAPEIWAIWGSSI